MNVLIVGAGIAGPTLAYWLRRFGLEVTIVEHAPHLREGGYVVDFWGAGFDVAERMGIVSRLMDEGYLFREMREVNSRGRRITGLDPRDVIEGATAGRYVTIARSALARAIYDTLDDEVETIFGDTVDALVDTGDRVQVRLTGGTEREFDLVVGADGLHSRIRSLVFGPEEQFERSLGIAVAAFDVDGYQPRDELIAITHTEVGMQALRLALHDGATMFCLIFRYDGVIPAAPDAQQALLRQQLGDRGWEVPAMLYLMPEARTFYLDSASQILMPEWSRGRIALVGDAAAAPSLLAGQGSALAMVEACILADELRRGDHERAFAAYHRKLATVVREKQDAAVGLGGAFAPRNHAQLLLRNVIVGLMGIPFIANRAMGRTLRDPIELPPIPA